VLIKSNNKWDAVRALINTLLKDKTVYCNECGSDYVENEFCCGDPMYGTHRDFVEAIIAQNKDTKASRYHDTGAGKDQQSFRWGLSLPPRFMLELETAFKTTYREKLLKDNHEMHRFMREFPAFCVCRKV
jgi:hypothetical protein